MDVDVAWEKAELERRRRVGRRVERMLKACIFGKVSVSVLVWILMLVVMGSVVKSCQWWWWWWS